MTMATPRRPAMQRRRSMLVAGMIGAGVMAGADEIVFHQILAWHHFYDRSTTTVALMSDGLLHAAELVVVVAGFFLFADLRSRGEVAPRSARAGAFLGLGGFQLFDGLVDHKVLQVHQVRYGVDLLPYDLAWNGAALVLLVIGVALSMRSRDEAARPPAEPR